MSVIAKQFKNICSFLYNSENDVLKGSSNVENKQIVSSDTQVLNNATNSVIRHL